MKSSNNLNAAQKKKIVLVGPKPPAIGGVSTHIHRLAEHTKTSRTNLDVQIIDPSICIKKWGRLAPICWLVTLLMKQCDILHIHKPDHLTRFWFILFFLTLIKRNVVFTFHNENFADEISSGEINFIRKYIFIATCNRFKHIVCVNERMAKTLILNGIEEEKVSVIPAFIAPQKLDTSTIPPEVRAFIDRHTPTLVGYVSNVYLYNGHDRYGGDMMLELTKRLRKPYPNIGLVLLMPNVDGANESGLASYREFVSEHALESNVYLCDVPVDMCALFTLIDIHIRPSNTDGDPIAIRESIALGVPTIASDCTFKPSPTIFHRDRDHDNFENVVSETINNLSIVKDNFQNIDNVDFSEKLINIYDKLLS